VLASVALAGCYLPRAAPRGWTPSLPCEESEMDQFVNATIDKARTGRSGAASRWISPAVTTRHEHPKVESVVQSDAIRSCGCPRPVSP
jgi:hypothetical protein